MPAYKYSFDSETGDGSVSVETGFDAEQFGDVELFGTLMQFKEMKISFWERIGIGGSICAKPLVYRGKVFFGCCDKNFYALNAETGEEFWRFSTNGMVLDNSGVDFKGDIVYFCSTDGNLYAVNTESGELLWKFGTESELRGDPRVDGDRVYFSSGNGCVYSVNAESGELVWKLDINADILMPVIHRGRVYGGRSNNTFFCISGEGNLLWKFHANDMIASWPAAFSEKHIYFGSWDNNMYCVDSYGKLVWKFGARDVAYSPIYYEGNIYFGSRDFCVYCLNASNGSFIWKFKTNGFVCNVIAKDNMIYFGSYDNNAYCLDAKTGKRVWKFPTNGFVNAVEVAGGRLYASSWDCNLYCLDAETGKLIWKFRSSMSTPSKISPPETGVARTAEITWAPETEEEKKKYKAGEGGRNYDINLSQYGVMDKGYVGSKKKGYIK